ncbi:MAG: tripartite tricarboxylate transporter TctB family protein [Armatimonadota bacterium]|nr:tripartite tricarboxylate transporter TctB family protein [Armatimonadota bacterium]
MPVRADRGFVVVLLVVCVAYAFEATRIFNPPAVADPLGPRAFPLFLGLAGIALAAAIVRDRSPRTGPEVTRQTLRALAGILAAMAAYAVLLPRLGFILTTTALLGVGFRYTGGRRPLVPAAAAALAIYLLFTRLLDLRLPRGILPWL